MKTVSLAKLIVEAGTVNPDLLNQSVNMRIWSRKVERDIKTTIITPRILTETITGNCITMPEDHFETIGFYEGEITIDPFYFIGMENHSRIINDKSGVFHRVVRTNITTVDPQGNIVPSVVNQEILQDVKAYREILVNNENIFDYNRITRFTEDDKFAMFPSEYNDMLISMVYYAIPRDETGYLVVPESHSEAHKTYWNLMWTTQIKIKTLKAMNKSNFPFALRNELNDLNNQYQQCIQYARSQDKKANLINK